MTGQAIDDAFIAVWDGKYHYNFWRPVTAIRNGDIDGNDATERDAASLPFIDTPMHPEYPCAHCTISGAVGAVLMAEIGTGPAPTLSTTSPLVPGVVRSWTKIDDFVLEVANARICDGVHYRTLCGSRNRDGEEDWRIDGGERVAAGLSGHERSVIAVTWIPQTLANRLLDQFVRATAAKDHPKGFKTELFPYLNRHEVAE